MIIWGCLIVLICGVMFLLGFNLEDNKISREIKSAANSYIKDNNMILSIGNATIVYLDELVDSKYISDKEKFEKKCIKSIVVSKGIISNEYTINTECDKTEEVSE